MAGGPGGRHLAAIMFTDIEGFTTLLGEDEEAARQVRERHRATLDQAIASHAGTVVNRMGDGTASVFPSATEAVAAAVEIQQALQAYPRIPVRIGIHLGEVAYDDEGAYGDAVNVASRIESVGAPGAVVVSERVQAHLGNQRWPTVELGPVTLKNVRESVRLYAVAAGDLVVPKAADVVARASGGATRGGDRPGVEKSIAVLPFTSLSPDPGDEFFADGISEEIINALTQLPELHVAARTSAFTFKGKTEDLRIVGEKLSVRTILEGSVRKAGNRLRITAQLVDAANGYHLWSERYDRELTDVFAIQDEIATAIASRLQVTLAGARRERLAHPGTSNVEAYESFLKGRVLQYRRGRAILDALPHFERAVEMDPQFAEAHAWIGDAYRLLGLYGVRPAAETLGRAKRAARRALELDPDLAEAHATLASLAVSFDRDHETAKGHWEAALRSDPRHVRALCERALWWLACVGGEAERAVAECDLAVENDPLNPWVAAMRCLTMSTAARHEDAIAEGHRAVELDPDSFLSHFVLAETLVWASRYEEAIPVARYALAISGRSPWGFGPLAVAYEGSGRRDLAEAIDDELRARARTESVQTFWLVATAGAAGRFADAAALAHRAIAEHDPLVRLGAILPDWRSLRDRPEFAGTLDELGFRPASA